LFLSQWVDNTSVDSSTGMVYATVTLLGPQYKSVLGIENDVLGLEERMLTAVLVPYRYPYATVRTSGGVVFSLSGVRTPIDGLI